MALARACALSMQRTDVVVLLALVILAHSWQTRICADAAALSIIGWTLNVFAFAWLILALVRGGGP